MAQKIQVGPNYFEDFTGGQGVGASNYFTYAQDQDTNFGTLRITINQMIDELNAVQGTNAIIGFDLATLTDPNGPFGPGVVTDGLLGEHSYKPVNFSGNQVTVRQGEAIVNGIRVVQGTDVVLFNTFPAAVEPLFLAIEPSGTPVLRDAAGGSGLDAYQLGVAGATQDFDPADTVQLAPIFNDGDNFALTINRRTAVGAAPTFPIFAHRTIEDRMLDTERLLAGFSAGVVPDLAGAVASVLGPMVFGGTVALPRLVPGDGATADTTSGFYRVAANRIGVSVLATQASEWGEQNTDEPSFRLRAGTSLADPVMTFLGDLDTGIGWVSANIARLIANGAEVMRWQAGQLAAVLGAVGAPAYSFIGDLDTGPYSPGANQYAIATGGIQAALFNAQQQVTSATQFRVATTDASFSIPNTGTLTNIELDTEVFDVGAMHDNVTNPDRHTVPTGGAGRYYCAIEVEFPDPGTPDGFRHIAITINGAVVREFKLHTTPGVVAEEETILTTSIVRDLAAADIVRAQAAHDDSGGALLVRSAVDVIKMV